MTHSDLVAIVGEAAALALEHAAGGAAVYIPKAAAETKAEAIRREWQSGAMTVPQIAALIGCSRQHVYRCISPN